MQYRITENVNLPFRVLPVVKELGRYPYPYPCPYPYPYPYPCPCPCP